MVDIPEGFPRHSNSMAMLLVFTQDLGLEKSPRSVFTSTVSRFSKAARDFSLDSPNFRSCLKSLLNVVLLVILLGKGEII